MKRLVVNAGYVALIYKKGDFKRLLTQGEHWLGFKEEARVFNMAYPLNIDTNINILVQNTKFKELTDVFNVRDTEIVLAFEDGVFKSVLTAGRYVYWKGLVKNEFIRADISKVEIGNEIEKDFLTNRLVMPFVRSFEVGPHEKGVLMVDGQEPQVIGSGVYNFWKNTTRILFAKADMRAQNMEISGQEMLTKDKASVRVNFDVKFIVKDIMKALYENKAYEKQLYTDLQLALRAYIGTNTLDELLAKKEDVSSYVMEKAALIAEQLGLVVLGAGIRDIILPGEVREIMNQVLVAEKKAQANTIMRREETASTRALLNSAKLMEDNPMLFKLKEMEYVEKIAERINNISLSNGNQVVDQLRQIFTNQ